MTSMIANIITSLILIAAVTGAVVYLYKQKKKGRSCIGCPNAETCLKKDSKRREK